MSIKGFKVNGVIEKYDYRHLDNLEVQSNDIANAAIVSRTIADTAVTARKIASKAVTEEKLGDDILEILGNKADINGSYTGMSVGMAEQLQSNVGIDDKIPYNFRTSGGSTEIGDREELNAVIGGTVAWNQLAEPETKTETKTDVTFTQNGDGSISASGTSAATRYIDLKTLIISGSGGSAKRIQNHKYAVLGGMSNALFIRAAKSSPTVTLFDAKADGIYSVSGIDGTETFSIFRLVVPIGATVNTTVYPQIFDLTLLFGSTIADYVYSLEQANAGAGLAYFKKLFPKPYYDYNAGELLSVKTSAHKMVGFNAYDNTSGKAKVVGGNVYQITGTYTALTLNGATITPDASGYFTPSENGELTVTGGNATDTCVHLKWDGERDGEYEAYQEWSYPLDSDLELRGIPKLDANNKLYYDGDTYESDGTVNRRYGIVDLGSLTWTKPTATAYMNFYSTGISSLVEYPADIASGASYIICSKYTGDIISSYNDGYIYITTAGQIRIKDTANASLTAAEFKSLLSGVYAVYKLATPTTEQADQYQQTQNVSDWGTEEYVDNRSIPVPVGNNVFYQSNLKAKLEMAPDSPSDGDGLYVVQQINGENTYVPLVVPNEIPDAPTTDGTYVLKATVVDGTATYSWVSE